MYVLICVLYFIFLLYAVKKCIFTDKKGETSETKKCIRCLKRVKIFHYKCPYCGRKEFIYDKD
jgi:hypothetical protein